MYMFGKVRNNGAVQFWSRKGKEEKENEKGKGSYFMQMFKTYGSYVLFLFFFFLCCEKKYFIPELSKHEDASVLENVNVQINFLIKDLLLW